MERDWLDRVRLDPREFDVSPAFRALAVGGKVYGGHRSWRQGWRRFSRDARIIVDDDKGRSNLAVDVRDLILQ